VALTLAFLLGLVACAQPTPGQFDGKRALAHVREQMELGPRPVGSEADRQTSDYIGRVLERNGWEVEYQEFAQQGLAVRNVIGKKGTGPLIVLATHLDTRPTADLDPQDRSQAVPGANDGASGVGVLLELSRVLGSAATDQAEIWLAFFDGEERGGMGSWPYCVGSSHLADELAARSPTEQPKYVIVVDMVGDVDQQLYYEWNSTLWVQERVWGVAADLGYEAQFVAEYRHNAVNSHTAFLSDGIDAALIVDLDYTYWRTSYDTLDKISADSLQRVGDVLETLLEGEPFRVGPEE